jgi:hypothetical protein
MEERRRVGFAPSSESYTSSGHRKTLRARQFGRARGFFVPGSRSFVELLVIGWHTWRRHSIAASGSTPVMGVLARLGGPSDPCKSTSINTFPQREPGLHTRVSGTRLASGPICSSDRMAAGRYHALTPEHQQLGGSVDTIPLWVSETVLFPSVGDSAPK